MEVRVQSKNCTERIPRHRQRVLFWDFNFRKNPRALSSALAIRVWIDSFASRIPSITYHDWSHPVDSRSATHVKWRQIIEASVLKPFARLLSWGPTISDRLVIDLQMEMKVGTIRLSWTWSFMATSSGLWFPTSCNKHQQTTASTVGSVWSETYQFNFPSPKP